MTEDVDPLELIKQAAHQCDQWRTIAIAYLVQCEKSGTHEKVLAMLDEEQKAMVKKEVATILERMKRGGI